MVSPDRSQPVDGFGDWDDQINRDLELGVDTPELDFVADKTPNRLKYLAAYALGTTAGATVAAGVYVVRRKTSKE